MSLSPYDQAALLAIQATVNALIKHIRETAPDAIETIRANAQAEAREIAPKDLENDAVNKVTTLLF